MTMRILFVTPYIPSVVRVRPYQIVRALAAQGHRVHLVALRPPEDRLASINGLREVCERVDVFPLSRARTLWNAVKALPTRLPFQAAYSHHPHAERFIRHRIASDSYDVVHVEHLRGAVLADRLNGAPRVYDAVDSIAFLFEQSSRMAPRFRQRLIAWLDLARTRHFEARAPRRFDRVLVTSPADAQAFQRLAGEPIDDRIAIVPNGVDLEYFSPVEPAGDPPTVLFSGKMSYHSNAAAALYLAREVMPNVWARHPGTRLLIVGKDPAAAIKALGEDPRITVTGYVDDIRPYFRLATIAVAPMRYGAGIQNKVLEAMSSGVPVIATPSVCNSLKAQPGKDLLIGADANELSEHVIRMLEDTAVRRALGAAGRQYVERHHRWSEIGRDLTAIYESTCARSRSSL